MALIKVQVFSKCLSRTVPIQVILPVDKIDFNGNLINKDISFKTLYLLHGIYGNETDWVANTNLILLAQEKNVAVVMPSGENKFYVDNEMSGDKYSEYIGKELVELTRQMFPLSRKREDTFIGGLSMGGYGAIVNGLKYHETFGCIAGLSNAFIIEKALQSTKGAEYILDNRDYYCSVFGNLDHLKGSDKDYKALIKQLKDSGEDIPKLYLTCGTQDILRKENIDYKEFLEKEGIPFTYEEWAGEHNWDYWSKAIVRVLNWLPLDVSTDGMHSGNVTKE